MQRRIWYLPITQLGNDCLSEEHIVRLSKFVKVNDDWIIRRLERWGRKDGMPFIGPKKAAILQSVVKERQPQRVFEVGTMAGTQSSNASRCIAAFRLKLISASMSAGYSALAMAKALKPGAIIVSIEKDFLWWLVAKRFVWQASRGATSSPGSKSVRDMTLRYSCIGTCQVTNRFLTRMPSSSSIHDHIQTTENALDFWCRLGLYIQVFTLSLLCLGWYLVGRCSRRNQEVGVRYKNWCIVPGW